MLLSGVKFLHKNKKNTEKQYTFFVIKTMTKSQIKKTLEYIFNIKAIKINTLNLPIKYKKISNILGRKSQYKKAILTLKESNSILD